MSKTTTKSLGLRQRLEQSDVLARGLGWVLASYLRLCFKTGRWHSAGVAELDAALVDGPVVIICWHGRLMMAPVVWQRRARVAIPRDPSPAGRLSAATQAHFGTEPFAIDMRGGNFGPVRAVIRMVRGGATLGLTADGPQGPNRVVHQAALDWARATGRPVFAFAWSQKRAWRLGSWDKLMVPKPFGGGAYAYQLWDGAAPKSADEDALRAARDNLRDTLDAVSKTADDLAGRT